MTQAKEPRASTRSGNDPAGKYPSGLGVTAYLLRLVGGPVGFLFVGVVAVSVLAALWLTIRGGYRLSVRWASGEV